MNFIFKLLSRLSAEYTWAKLDLMTCLVYNQRKPRVEIIPSSCSAEMNTGFCDLAVVTFNNAEVVEYQIRTLRKFFVYPFRYTVFDNSTNDDIAEKIQEVCEKYKVGYVRLPRQEFLPKGFGSYSHGMACNWLFEKYIKNGGAKYFGLLDHDIFLTAPFDISQHLQKQFFYGTKHRFYVWPGLWFMPMQRLLDKGVDFRPSFHHHGDTGARNGAIHFKNLDWTEFNIVEDVKCLFDDTDNDIFRNGYSLMGGCWLHCWNASDYMGKGVNTKMQRIYVKLEKALRDKGL